VPVIGVDIEGSDVPSDRLLEGLCKTAHEVDGRLVCYCTHEGSAQSTCVDLIVCASAIMMEDDALKVVRKKKDFTLTRSMRDLACGRIDALVTFANTGALTASAVIYLEKFPTLRRPGLLVEMPLCGKSVIVMDVGALLCPKAQDLYGFAKLATAYARSYLHLNYPRVGLLNIGKEAIRGPEELCRADEMLQGSGSFCDYVGNVEPFDVISGKVDVCITDGFTGNIFLKTVEGAAKISGSSSLRHENRAALLAGVNGLVVKCHGEGSTQALTWAVQHAATLVQMDLIGALRKSFI
jgi:phosphate acyltransferase